MTHPYFFIILTVFFVLIFSTNGNAQTSSSPLRFDREIMEMIKIVTKKPEDSRNRSAFTPSKQLKPAHEVWIQWEQIKASEKSLQKVVNADTPVAELKILAEKGNQNAVTFLREYLLQQMVDENTSETMLTELAKVEHKESIRILQEQKDTRAAKQKAEQEAKRKAEEEQKRLQEERKKIEEEKARLAKEKEDARKRQEEEERLKAQEEANRLKIEKAKEAAQTSEVPEAEKAVSLDQAILESGFRDDDGNLRIFKYDHLKLFSQYGNAELEIELEEARSDVYNSSPFDKADAQKKVDAVWVKIKKVQAEIASKTFFKEYSYEVKDVNLLGNERCMFTMNINTNYNISKFRGGTFPMPGVKGRLSRSEYGKSTFSIRGDTGSIQELAEKNNNYKVRILFKNLRASGYSFLDYPYADVIRIDVVKLENEI